MTIKTRSVAGRAAPVSGQTKTSKPVKLPAPAVPDRFMSALPEGHRFDSKAIARQHAVLAELQNARDPHRES